MTPTRVLIGLAVVASAGYAVISSTGSDGPKYLGDMPSIMAHSTPAPPPITHETPGPPVPDPPHTVAHPVVPEAPAAPPPAVPGPGALGPPAPAINGGGVGGSSNAQPGVGGPASTLLSGGLLSGLPLLGGLPTNVDLSKVCLDAAGHLFAYVPCDQLPLGSRPPVIPPVIPPVTSTGP